MSKGYEHYWEQHTARGIDCPNGRAYHRVEVLDAQGSRWGFLVDLVDLDRPGHAFKLNWIDLFWVDQESGRLGGALTD